VARNLAIAAKKTRFRAWSLKECFEVFSALEHLQRRECENSRAARCRWWRSRACFSGRRAWCLLDEPSQGLRLASCRT
jgi:branched-chain amino acid transport system ATP-binding protein